MTRRRLAGYAVLAMSTIAFPLAVTSPTLAATKATSCKNKAISSDVFLIDAKGISCAQALPVAKKWLAATGYTFGLDDPPTDGLVLQVSGYRCVYREISSGGAAGVQARTTCTKGKKVIRIGLGAGGKSVYTACRERTGLGPTYVTYLNVRGTTCSEAVSVVKAFHRCRYANGGPSARCTSKVMGYACTEQRTVTPALKDVSFDSRVVCEKGKKIVKHGYQQDIA